MAKPKPKTRKPENPPKIFMEEVSARNSETGHDELYLVIDGRRVANRGYSDRLQAMTWTPLVEDFKIIEDDDPDDGVPVFDAGEVQMLPEPKGAKQ